MSRITLTIEDADRGVDYRLTLDYDTLPAEPELGITAGTIEIGGGICMGVTTTCGPDFVVATAAPSKARDIFAWCAEKYGDAIKAKIAAHEYVLANRAEEHKRRMA